MRKLILLFLLSSFSLFAQTAIRIAGMDSLSPEVRDHLTTVLKELSRIETGKFLKDKISPEIRFETRAMSSLGQANGRNCITLEALRLNKDTRLADKTAPDKVQICFTAEILAHELLHNAQFRAGLFRYPQGTSGWEAVLFEKLLELQAKYIGENTFAQIRSLPEYAGVRSKPGLFLVLQRQSENLPKEYAETLWQNNGKTASGQPLYRNQIREAAAWNLSYAEQAFRNNYGRFLASGPGAGEAVVKAHLQKILDFTGLTVSADFLLKNAPVKPVDHGIACYENGRKVLEFIAVQDGYLKRRYAGQTVRETKVTVRH